MAKFNGVRGLEDVNKLIAGLQKRNNLLQSKDGLEIELGQANQTWLSKLLGTFLHQDQRDERGMLITSEAESAQLERENPEVFKYLQNLRKELFDTLR